MKRNLTREAVRNCVDFTQIFGLDYLECKKLPVYKKRSPALLPSFFLWCGKQDWILTARRRSVSAALRPHSGLIHYGFFKSCFCLDISLEQNKNFRSHGSSYLVRETGLDSRGSSPLGQRRSQAPLGLDSLRLLQVRFPSLQKRSPTLSPSFLLWCGKQDLNLHEIAFTRT